MFKTVTKISAVGATDGNVEAGVIGDGTDEGKDVTFTINRTNVNNAADTIYLSTAPGTAKETDFEGFSGKEVKFAAFETQKTVTVKAKSDSEAEKDRVATELKSEVADLSLEISQKVASSMTKKDQQKLIDKFIKDMG